MDIFDKMLHYKYQLQIAGCIYFLIAKTLSFHKVKNTGHNITVLISLFLVALISCTVLWHSLRKFKFHVLVNEVKSTYNRVSKDGDKTSHWKPTSRRGRWYK